MTTVHSIKGEGVLPSLILNDYENSRPKVQDFITKNKIYDARLNFFERGMGGAYDNFS